MYIKYALHCIFVLTNTNIFRTAFKTVFDHLRIFILVRDAAIEKHIMQISLLYIGYGFLFVPFSINPIIYPQKMAAYKGTGLVCTTVHHHQNIIIIIIIIRYLITLCAHPFVFHRSIQTAQTSCCPRRGGNRNIKKKIV